MQDLKEMLRGNSICENVVFIKYILICQKLAEKGCAFSAFLWGNNVCMCWIEDWESHIAALAHFLMTLKFTFTPVVSAEMKFATSTLLCPSLAITYRSVSCLIMCREVLNIYLC
jgi:hypothetical protein